MLAKCCLGIGPGSRACRGDGCHEVGVEHDTVDTFERPQRRRRDRHATGEVLEHLQRRYGVGGRRHGERHEADVESRSGRPGRSPCALRPRKTTLSGTSFGTPRASPIRTTEASGLARRNGAEPVPIEPVAVERAVVADERAGREIGGTLAGVAAEYRVVDGVRHENRVVPARLRLHAAPGRVPNRRRRPPW